MSQTLLPVQDQASLIPFPPLAIASLRAVCQRCCTPLLKLDCLALHKLDVLMQRDCAAWRVTSISP